VYAIPAVGTQAGEWCKHCAVGKGCKIYDDRPATCVLFECLWLQSQQHAPLPIELRPDQCKVVFNMSTNPNVVTATALPGYPDAWKKRAVRGLIDKLQRMGLAVSFGLPAALLQLLFKPDGTVKQVEMTPPDENGMQWSKGDV
jgi:hypothetical protein